MLFPSSSFQWHVIRKVLLLSVLERLIPYQMIVLGARSSCIHLKILDHLFIILPILEGYWNTTISCYGQGHRSKALLAVITIFSCGTHSSRKSAKQIRIWARITFPSVVAQYTRIPHICVLLNRINGHSSGPAHYPE